MGDTVGPYRIGRLIGGGGIGEVREATWASGQRPSHIPAGPLALKRVAPEHRQQPAIAALFAAEVEHAFRFEHRCLSTAVDRGDADGGAYLVMKKLPGLALAEAAPAAQHMRSLATELADALDHMHGRGFVHCDVSPRNVIVDGERAWLIDFSAATALGHAQDQPRGSYAYMAPEQVRGQKLDGRCDQFALAVLLWESLSGARLFFRPAQHLTLVAVVEEDAPALPRPDLPATAAALARALAKEPGARFPSCRELVEAMDL